MNIIIAPAYRAYQTYLAQLPARFEQEGETLHAGRNCVKRFFFEDQEWIVKRYKRPHFIQRIVYTYFRKSKAERAFRYACRFRQKGVNTPEEVAFIEYRRHGLFYDSYFISTACHDPAVTQRLPKTGDFDHPLADALALFLAGLHQKGILHGDLNLNNILYQADAEGNYRFTLIDTNRTRFLEAPSRRACIDNLKRITHRRDLLQYIVGQYASARGWDTELCVRQVVVALDKFEQRNLWKKKLKKKI